MAWREHCKKICTAKWLETNFKAQLVMNPSVTIGHQTSASWRDNLCLQKVANSWSKDIFFARGPMNSPFFPGLYRWKPSGETPWFQLRWVGFSVEKHDSIGLHRGPQREKRKCKQKLRGLGMTSLGSCLEWLIESYNHRCHLFKQYISMALIYHHLSFTLLVVKKRMITMITTWQIWCYPPGVAPGDCKYDI